MITLTLMLAAGSFVAVAVDENGKSAVDVAAFAESCWCVSDDALRECATLGDVLALDPAICDAPAPRAVWERVYRNFAAQTLWRNHNVREMLREGKIAVLQIPPGLTLANLNEIGEHYTVPHNWYDVIEARSPSIEFR